MQVFSHIIDPTIATQQQVLHLLFMIHERPIHAHRFNLNLRPSVRPSFLPLEGAEWLYKGRSGPRV